MYLYTWILFVFYKSACSNKYNMYSLTSMTGLFRLCWGIDYTFLLHRAEVQDILKLRAAVKKESEILEQQLSDLIQAYDDSMKMVSRSFSLVQLILIFRWWLMHIYFV